VAYRELFPLEIHLLTSRFWWFLEEQDRNARADTIYNIEVATAL